jgi:hypothetical protein
MQLLFTEAGGGGTDASFGLALLNLHQLALGSNLGAGD